MASYNDSDTFPGKFGSLYLECQYQTCLKIETISQFSDHEVIRKKGNESTVYKKHPDQTALEAIPLSAETVITPAGIIILDENIGWVWDRAGAVYFTNDGFQNCYKEDVGGIVDGMFRSADGKTAFAYTIDHDQHRVTIFRY